MAEYFPLLDRAVSGLTEPTAEARRSIYDRARTALIGQLRRMDPPVPEDDIAREGAALDEAIARVEARFSDHGGGHGGAGDEASRASAEPPSAAVPIAPAVAPVAPSVTVPSAGPVRAPALPTGAPPVVPPPSRERPVLGLQPAAARDAAAQPAAAPPVVPGRAPVSTPGVAPSARPGALGRAPLPPRGTRPVMALRPVVAPPARGASAARASGSDPAPGAVAASTATEDPASAASISAVAASEAAASEITASAAARPTPSTGPAAAPAGAAGVASFDAALDAAGRADGGEPATAAERGSLARPREGGARPPAPRPRATPGWSRTAIAAALVAVVVVMAGMGVAAYRFRDRPEQVVATRTAVTDASGVTAGKVADRAASAGTDADAGAAHPASGAAVPAPIPQGLDAGNLAPSIAVAQRAALLVDAPDDPQRVRTYVGTVVWHLDSVSPGGGQPLATAVKADVDIPDAKLKVTMLMQRNPEPQLPASHTIEFHFLPQPGNTLGPVKQVNVPEMRRDDDAPTGDPLAGVPVAITDNYFLVGLTRGGAESQNLRLITERNWFDMSLLFTSGKLGKLTFEKGAGGQRMVDDALKAWK